MDCEPATINASSFANNLSRTEIHLHLIRAQIGDKCESVRFQLRAVTVIPGAWTILKNLLLGYGQGL